MTAFRWLHLADLHRGLGEDEWLWPTFEELFLEDLARVLELCGPLDLILFSGDLTQTGDAREFEKVGEILEKIRGRLLELQGAEIEPVLLAVPGNHDLVRPSSSKTLIELRSWHELRALRHEFWKTKSSPHRRLVDKAFENYQTWWQSWLERNKAAYVPYREGELAGDFSFVLEKAGFELGVVGLNSTFLQLESGDYRRRLDFSAQQLHLACGGNGASWAQARHLCLLLSHHPPDWLSAEGEATLNGDIATPGRFAVHLFGHQHEATTIRLAAGGAADWRRWQADALFGLETWGSAGKRRRHGYSIGSLEIRGQNAELRLWPRRALQQVTGVWRLAPAFEVADLDLDQATFADGLKLLRDPPERFRSRDLEQLVEVAPRRGPLLRARNDGSCFPPPTFRDCVLRSPSPRRTDHDLHRQVLTGFRFRGGSAFGVIFRDCNLTATSWSTTKLIRLQFVDCDMSGIAVYDSWLAKTFFYDCRFSDALFVKVHFQREVEFKKCRIQSLNVVDCRIDHLEFNECHFENQTRQELATALGSAAAFVSCTFYESC